MITTAVLLCVGKLTLMVVRSVSIELVDSHFHRLLSDYGIRIKITYRIKISKVQQVGLPSWF